MIACATQVELPGMAISFCALKKTLLSRRNVLIQRCWCFSLVYFLAYGNCKQDNLFMLFLVDSRFSHIKS
jgi:hypothetical protein